MRDSASNLPGSLVMTAVLFCATVLTIGAVARDIQKRSPGKSASGTGSAAQGPGQSKALATLDDDKDDKCLCSCGMCYTKPEWRPPPPPNCTTYCIYKVKHYEPCFSGDICAPLDFVPVYDYYQIQIPSKVRGWNPQLMNGRLLTSTTTTEEPPAVLEADNCEFLDLLKDAKIAI